MLINDSGGDMKKDYSIDIFLYKLINRNLFEIAFWVAICMSVVIRIHLAPQCISGDFTGFVTDWTTAYASKPFWKALGYPITNYYEPYNFFLDIIAHLPFPVWGTVAFASCLAEYVTAFYIYRIVLLIGTNGNIKYTKNMAQIATVSILYLPMAMMNSALWKQCDAIYTCFAVISLYCFLKEKYTESFVVLAISFLFKLQAVFIFPFYIIIYICKQKFSILKFLWVPFLYIVAGIPAVIAQRGIRTTYLTYFKQMQDVPMMSSSSPSIYRFGMRDFNAFGMIAVFITITILMMTACYLYLHREAINVNMMYYLAGWISLTCFVFLPEMHERYDYMPLILLTSFIVVYRQRLIWCMIILNLCTAITYSYYLFEFNEISLIVIALFYNVAYAIITVDFIRVIKANRGNFEGRDGKS